MSPRYAAPEQIRREKLSEESDIFSLGLVLYYLFINEHPDIKREKVNENLDKSEVDKRIVNVIKKAINVVREDRYSSIDEFIESVYFVKREIEANQNSLILNYKPTVANKLVELGKVESDHELEVIKFIKDSLLHDPKIYQSRNGNLNLVGNKVRFQIVFNKTNEALLEKVWNVSIEQNDFENSKGVTIGASIEVRKKEYNTLYETESVYLEYLKENIQKEFKENNEKNKGKENLNELLKVWNDYLNQKKTDAFTKTEMGKYTSFSYSESDNFLSVELENKNFNGIFEKEDIIQLTNKTGKKKAIGVFDKYLSETKISVIPNNKFDESKFSKRGNIGINNYFDNILTYRYSSAMKQLFSNTAVNRELLDILNTPQLASFSKKRFQINQKFNEKILQETMDIIEDALSSEDLYIIQGPPGTGKTTLITEIIAQIYHNKPESKVLFVSPSHVAVDHAVKNIRKQLVIIDKEIESKIVRLGKEVNINDGHEVFQIEKHKKNWAEKIKQKSFAYLKDEVQKIDSDRIKKENKNNLEITKGSLQKYLLDINKTDRSELINYIDDTYSFDYKKYSVIKDWYQNLSNESNFSSEIIKNSFLVSSTCSGLSSYDDFDNVEFEWVIIDEAARATVPELLIPMVRGNKTILVGDHKQLPPVVNFDENELVKHETKELLEASFFEKLYDSIGESLKVTLTTQFRMKSEIGNMIDDLYYDSEIKNLNQDKEYILKNIYKPIQWLDTSSLSNCNQVQEETSFKNYAELSKIIDFLDELNANLVQLKKNKTVGIISGYEAQKNLVENIIISKKWDYLDIVVNNVDAFQGSEKDIIIYSIVRSNNKNELGYLKDERRLNVSLSRAKEMLVIVGNVRVAEYTPSDTNPFRRLYKYIQENPTDCTIKSY